MRNYLIAIVFTVVVVGCTQPKLDAGFLAAQEEVMTVQCCISSGYRNVQADRSGLSDAMNAVARKCQAPLGGKTSTDYKLQALPQGYPSENEYISALSEADQSKLKVLEDRFRTCHTESLEARSQRLFGGH